MWQPPIHPTSSYANVPMAPSDSSHAQLATTLPNACLTHAVNSPATKLQRHRVVLYAPVTPTISDQPAVSSQHVRSTRA